MTIDNRRSARTSPAIIVLLAGILVVLVVLVITVYLSNRGNGGTTDTGGSTTKPKYKTLKDGEVLKRDDAKDEGMDPQKPAKSVANTTRLKETYVPGRTYRIVGKAKMDSRGSNKDWGIETVTNLHYVAEFEVYRTIEKNDGQTLVEVREFRKARNLTVAAELEDVRIDVGPLGTLLLGAVDWRLGKPGTFILLQGQNAKPYLDRVPGLQQIANQVVTDEATRVFAFVSKLEGKKVRITYRNGVGVQSIEPIGCSLSGDEQVFLFDTASLSDAYVMPDLDSKEGNTWTVDGVELLPIIDPSMHARLTGSISVRQGPITQANGRRSTTLSLVRGSNLQLVDQDDTSFRIGKWYPQGRLNFSFDNKIVSSAELHGELYLEQRSTNHIIFEAKHTIRPDYLVTYSCEVRK